MTRPNQPINPLTGRPNPVAPPPEAAEPYPSEMPKIKDAYARLQAYWLQKRVEDPADAASAFNQMATSLFGEAGWKVTVEWLEARNEDGTPNNPFAPGVPLYVPQVALAGRTRVEEETDHDRMQHDIVHGLADGKKGWIDPNTGNLKDEPKRKLIL